jgi:hypothetical protein
MTPFLSQRFRPVPPASGYLIQAPGATRSCPSIWAGVRLTARATLTYSSITVLVLVVAPDAGIATRTVIRRLIQQFQVQAAAPVQVQDPARAEVQAWVEARVQAEEWDQAEESSEQRRHEIWGAPLVRDRKPEAAPAARFGHFRRSKKISFRSETHTALRRETLSVTRSTRRPPAP